VCLLFNVSAFTNAGGQALHTRETPSWGAEFVFFAPLIILLVFARLLCPWKTFTNHAINCVTFLYFPVYVGYISLKIFCNLGKLIQRLLKNKTCIL
uniref:Uncharacterized protein n=1 Tax=Oryctolagus cuniculus TaxID=9986 RepID=A0A5F9CWX2_RABIT